VSDSPTQHGDPESSSATPRSGPAQSSGPAESSVPAEISGPAESPGPESPGPDSSANAESSGHPESGEKVRPRRKRRFKRIGLTTAAALVVVVCLVAGGVYIFANHILSSVHRIHVSALQPAKPGSSMTVLLTSYAVGASTASLTAASKVARPSSGLIALIHLNANRRAGAVISVPPTLLVSIPGHGRKDIGKALAIGGPSLLVKTVEQLTDVPINHYSILTLAGALRVIDALKGVNVDVPYTTTSAGFTFHKGINHINSHQAIAYARQPNISELGRELLQQNLIRAILSKIAGRGMLRGATVDYGVVKALAGALSVDSNLTNSGLASLAVSLSGLGGNDGTFVNTPIIDGSPTHGGDNPVHINQALSAKLWLAIRHDSVAAFALRYPATVTSRAPDLPRPPN